jgi:release factor glutamine methyltransferase
MFEQLTLDLTPRYGAGEARSIARIVFEDAFGARRPGEKAFSPDEVLRFEDIRRRLLQGEPVQYVLGQADFFGLKFAVTPAVLIPRQETEELVAWVLDWLKTQSIVFPHILDIGLGSGCIAVALKHKRREIQVFGLEKSAEALALATENARNLLGNGAFTFFQSDILAPDTHPNLPPLDVVVSNPPYIAQQERDLMPEHVLAHEPEMALFVEGDDPLLFYRAIGLFAQRNLAPGGALFLECNEFNAPQVADLLGHIGFARIELRRDLSGADRLVMGCL